VIQFEGYMAKKATRRASNGRLEEALATLITNQAHFVAQMARMDERSARSDERFARIESELSEIKNILRDHHRILLHHEQILENLPEAIREKIGFVKPR